MKKRTKVSSTNESRLVTIETILFEHAKDLNRFGGVLQDHITDAQVLIHEWRNGTLETSKNIKELNDKIDKILNIKVNGTIGLENALKLVYEATAGERAKISLRTSLRKWFDTHKTFKAIVTSKFFQHLIIITFTILLVSALGLPGIDINILKILLKLL